MLQKSRVVLVSHQVRLLFRVAGLIGRNILTATCAFRWLKVACCWSLARHLLEDCPGASRLRKALHGMNNRIVKP
jgi:hypothetical protein